MKDHVDKVFLKRHAIQSVIVHEDEIYITTSELMSVNTANKSKYYELEFKDVVSANNFYLDYITKLAEE